MQMSDVREEIMGKYCQGLSWGKVLDAKNSVWKNTGGQTVGRLK